MSNSGAEANGLAAAKKWQAAFNACDYERQADMTNFPHLRLANGRFAYIENREQFIENARTGEPKRIAEGWHHSVGRNMHAVQIGPDKVHVVLINDRCREDGSVYISFDTLWIVTLQDGHWGIKFRSSYLR